MIIKEFGYTELPIEFNSKKHEYILDNLPLIGTTTIIGMKKKDFLMYWTVKEMYKYLKTNWKLSKKYTGDEKEELLMSGKTAWTRKKDKALDSGTIAHDMIDDSIRSGEREDPEEIENEEVRNAYQAFIDWEKEHKIEYLASEIIVGSRKNWVAGTIDAVAMVDDRLEVLDWKTSNQLSEDVFLQTASYRMCLEEGGVEGEIGRRCVRFDKKGNGFEDYVIPSDYNKDIRTFLSLLTTYRWDRDINEYKNYKGQLNK